MNRGCKVESYSNKYFPNTSLTKTCQPLCLDDNKKDRMPTIWIIAIIPNFSQFFFNKPQKLQKSQFLLGTLLPPVTLDLINLSKNCDFSNFSQFLEESQKLQKSQFLLDTLVPPVILNLIHHKLEAWFYWNTSRWDSGVKLHTQSLQLLEDTSKSELLLQIDVFLVDKMLLLSGSCPPSADAWCIPSHSLTKA